MYIAFRAIDSIKGAGSPVLKIGKAPVQDFSN